MGSNPRAHLAYGYDLGTDEDPRFAEKGEYDTIQLAWFDDEAEDEDGDTLGFVEQLFNHLHSLIPDAPPADSDWRRQTVAEEHYGIRIEHSGSSEYSPGCILVAPDSHRSVEWSDTMELDLLDLERRRSHEDWDAALTTAIRALGITPTQDGPKWLVFPSYG